MGQLCTVHVKVLLTLTWAVTFQSEDNKHGGLAAKTGNAGTGPLTDNKRAKRWGLFFFYVLKILYLLLFLWYNRETLDLCLFVHMPPGTVNHLFTSVSSVFVTVCRWWFPPFEVSEVKASWAQPPHPLQQRVQQHTLPLTEYCVCTAAGGSCPVLCCCRLLMELKGTLVST